MAFFAFMLSNDEWRKVLGDPDMSEKDLGEFLTSLRRFLDQFLDEYFKEELGPDDGH